MLLNDVLPSHRVTNSPPDWSCSVAPRHDLGRGALAQIKATDEVAVIAPTADSPEPYIPRAAGNTTNARHQAVGGLAVVVLDRDAVVEIGDVAPSWLTQVLKSPD